MKKDIHQVISQTIRQVLLDYLYGIFKFSIFALFTLLLIFNIVFSQNIHQLYFQLMEEKKTTAVQFLRKITSLVEFETILSTQKRIHDPTIETEVYMNDIQREKFIYELELLLSKNKQLRDVLYALYILYDEKGEKAKAQEYLEKARLIDPMVVN